MKSVTMVVGLFAALGGIPAWALDIEPASRQKAVAAAVATASIPPAAAPGRQIELPELHAGVDTNGRTLAGSCGLASVDLCYDYREGRLIYRPTRNWMPDVPGFTPEHISVRRDTVVFKYSFR